MDRAKGTLSCLEPQRVAEHASRTVAFSPEAKASVLPAGGASEKVLAAVDGEQAPLSGDAAQLVGSAILEPQL
jgi:hypothetical protein